MFVNLTFIGEYEFERNLIEILFTFFSILFANLYLPR